VLFYRLQESLSHVSNPLLLSHVQRDRLGSQTPVRFIDRQGQGPYLDTEAGGDRHTRLRTVCVQNITGGNLYEFEVHPPRTSQMKSVKASGRAGCLLSLHELIRCLIHISRVLFSRNHHLMTPGYRFDLSFGRCYAPHPARMYNSIRRTRSISCIQCRVSANGRRRGYDYSDAIHALEMWT
jgi:hypothetical protein